MSTQQETKPDKPVRAQRSSPATEVAPPPGVEVTRKPNGIVITNYTGRGH